MCALSAENGERPCDRRRITAQTRSRTGINTAAATTIMGDINATISTVPYRDMLILPDAEMDAAAPQAALASRRQRLTGSAVGVGSVGFDETGAFDVGADDHAPQDDAVTEP